MKTSVSFDNPANAFIHRTNKNITHAIFIFKIANNPILYFLLSRLMLLVLKSGLPLKPVIKNTLFKQFCGGESLEDCIPVIYKMGQSGIGTTLGFGVESRESETEFEKTKDKIVKMIHFAKNTNWVKSIALKVSTLGSGDKNRLDTICTIASKAGIPVIIDAEESWIQNSIDAIALLLMKKNNTVQPVVFMTMQMYRSDRIQYLNRILIHAKNTGFFPGIQLVRGAYWEQELDTARNGDLGLPVFRTKQLSDRSFHEAIEICLKNIDRVALGIATHNEESCHFLIRKMEELNLKPNHPNIHVSQLFGMSDPISYNLAAAGYNVRKYLPYGPVKRVIPCLIRRVNRNKSIRLQMKKELVLLLAERERRRAKKNPAILQDNRASGLL